MGKSEIGRRYKRRINPVSNITDVSEGKYGSLETTSKHRNNCSRRNNEFSLIKNIQTDLNGKTVLIRGRLQTSRMRGKQCFIVVRQQDHTIQCFLQAGTTVSQHMLKFSSNINRESIIDIIGKVQATSMEIRSCTAKWVEILVKEVWVISRAEVLPIQVIDCARSENTIIKKVINETHDTYNLNIHVNQDKRLDNRVLDLRTPANQAIFRLESAVTQCFREFLSRKGFIEIHTPKIINAASEGGANVFNVSYFKTFAYLAQSPQLYKQMAIAADFERVFTIGSVFRAEESHTSRHLTEFIGLDLEMTFKHDYNEVLDVIEEAFIEIFRTLQDNYSDEILTIRQQHHSKAFKFSNHAPRMTYSEAMAMLRAVGANIESNSDLTAKHEKLLGQLVRQKYNTDFFILHKYPISVRPFYVMPDPEIPNLSNSYDVFMRGEEVMSGGQRIHDVYILKEAASRNGVNLEKIKDYIDAFRYGCSPHGGGGIGLERTVALFLGLDNVRKTSMFPRDPNRLTP